MRYEHLQVSLGEHVTRITLNRPEVLNALNDAMHLELECAFDAFAANDTQRVAVITGAGERAFCAGSDLKAAAAGDGLAKTYPPHGYAGLVRRFDLDKPLIAAVNGVAYGGGFEIALACDLVIAAEGARFALPEPLVGAVALGGGLHRLARQIGLKKAMGIILGAGPVGAREGEALGFVNEVVPAEDLAAATERWCERLLRCAPLALRASKQTVMRGLDESSLEAAIDNQSRYPAYVAWRHASDTIEGPRAFAEKRAPRWQGK